MQWKSMQWTVAQWGTTLCVLVLAVSMLGSACGGAQFVDGDFVRQGATGLEVPVPEPALRAEAYLTALLDVIEASLDAEEPGDVLVSAVTAWIEENSAGAREATVAIVGEISAVSGHERRALEEALGEHFHAAGVRWRRMRERVAQAHPAHANAVFQRVIQLNPDA